MRAGNLECRHFTLSVRRPSCRTQMLSDSYMPKTEQQKLVLKSLHCVLQRDETRQYRRSGRSYEFATRTQYCDAAASLCPLLRYDQCTFTLQPQGMINHAIYSVTPNVRMSCSLSRRFSANPARRLAESAAIAALPKAFNVAEGDVGCDDKFCDSR